MEDEPREPLIWARVVYPQAREWTCDPARQNDCRTAHDRPGDNDVGVGDRP